MILKGRSRADGAKLASYLLSSKNEQVRILDVRGLVADERSPQGLRMALGDMDELATMTRAKVSLFHLALNPDDRDELSADDWQYSIEKAEKALGLEEQPRAIVSHIYQGKEHLHVVWSRVNIETRTCIEMSFSHRKLCGAAREIETELGLHEPPPRAPHAPKTRQRHVEIEVQQQERAMHSKGERQAHIERAWKNAGSGQEFKAHIEAAGYRLAEGRRGLLVVDQNDEAHSISRALKGVKAREVRERLADLGALPLVEEVRDRKAQTTIHAPAQSAEPPAIEESAEVLPRRAQQLTVEQMRAELAGIKAQQLGDVPQHDAPDEILRRHIQEMRAQIEATRRQEALEQEQSEPSPRGPSL